MTRDTGRGRTLHCLLACTVSGTALAAVVSSADPATLLATESTGGADDGVQEVGPLVKAVEMQAGIYIPDY